MSASLGERPELVKEGLRRDFDRRRCQELSSGVLGNNPYT